MRYRKTAVHGNDVCRLTDNPKQMRKDNWKYFANGYPDLLVQVSFLKLNNLIVFIANCNWQQNKATQHEKVQNDTSLAYNLAS